MKRKLKLILIGSAIGFTSISSLVVVSCKRDNTKIDDVPRETRKPYEISKEDVRLKLLGVIKGDESKETKDVLNNLAEMLSDISNMSSLNSDEIDDKLKKDTNLNNLKETIEKEFSALFEINSTKTIEVKQFKKIIKMIKSFKKEINNMIIGKEIIKTPNGESYSESNFKKQYDNITEKIITHITPKPKYIEEYKDKSYILFESIFSNQLLKGLIPEETKTLIDGVLKGLINEGVISIPGVGISLKISDVTGFIDIGLIVIKESIQKYTDIINNNFDKKGINVFDKKTWTSESIANKVVPELVNTILDLEEVSSAIPKEILQIIKALIPGIVPTFILGVLKSQNLYDKEKGIDKIYDWATEEIGEDQVIKGDQIYNVLSKAIEPLYNGIINNDIIKTILDNLDENIAYGIPELVQEVFDNFKYLNSLLNYHYYSNTASDSEEHDLLKNVLPKVLDWALDLMPEKDSKPNEDELKNTISVQKNKLEQKINNKTTDLKDKGFYDSLVELVQVKDIIKFYETTNKELLDNKKDKIDSIKDYFVKEFKLIFDEKKLDKESYSYKKFLTTLNELKDLEYTGKDSEASFYLLDDKYISIRNLKNKYSNYIDLIIESLDFKTPNYLNDSISKSLELYKEIINKPLISNIIPDNIKPLADKFMVSLLEDGSINVDGLLSLDLSTLVDVIPTALGYLSPLAKPYLDKISQGLYDLNIDITNKETWKSENITNKVLPGLVKTILNLDEIKELIPAELLTVINAIVPNLIQNLVSAVLLANNLYDTEKNIDRIYELATEGLEADQKVGSKNIYNVISNILKPLLQGLLQDDTVTSLIKLLDNKEATEAVESIKKSLDNFDKFNNVLNYHYYSSVNHKNDGQQFLGTILIKALDWALDLMPEKEYIITDKEKAELRLLELTKPFLNISNTNNIEDIKMDNMNLSEATINTINQIIRVINDMKLDKDHSLNTLKDDLMSKFVDEEQEKIISDINKIWESDITSIVNLLFKDKESEAKDFKDKLIRAIREMDRMSVPYDFYIPEEFKIIEGLDVQDIFKNKDGTYSLSNIIKYFDFASTNPIFSKIVEGLIQPIWEKIGLDYNSTKISFSKTKSWTVKNIKEVLLPQVFGFVDTLINIPQLQSIKIGTLLSNILTNNEDLISQKDWESIQNIFDSKQSETVTGQMITEMIYELLSILKKNAGNVIDNLVTEQLSITDVKPVDTISKILDLIERISEHKLKVWGFEDYEKPLKTIITYSVDFLISVVKPKEDQIIKNRASIYSKILPILGTINPLTNKYEIESQDLKELVYFLTDYIAFSKNEIENKNKYKITIAKLVTDEQINELVDSLRKFFNNKDSLIDDKWKYMSEEQKQNIINNYVTFLKKDL